MDDMQKPNDEIDFFDILEILIKWKRLILGITFGAAIFILLYSFISVILPPSRSFLPNKYTPKALMLINESSSSGSSISSMLNSSGLSSLASLAGINAVGGSSYKAIAVFLTSTNTFFDAISQKFDLASRYKLKNNGKSSYRNILRNKIKAVVDKDSGVLSISFTDSDPVFAQAVTNYCVEYLEGRFDEMGIDKNKLQKQNLEINIDNTYNDILKLEAESQSLESSVSAGTNNRVSSIMLDANRIKLELSAKESVYTQLKTQYELLKVSMASEAPVFQVLEYAEVPDQKSGPSRGTLCLIVTFSAFFGSIFLVFVLNAIENMRNDSVSMAKLRKRK